MKQNPLVKNLLQSVLVAIIMALLGGVAKTYLAVHDLQLAMMAQTVAITDLKVKLEWLYRYDFSEKPAETPGPPTP